MEKEMEEVSAWGKGRDFPEHFLTRADTAAYFAYRTGPTGGNSLKLYYLYWLSDSPEFHIQSFPSPEDIR